MTRCANWRRFPSWSRCIRWWWPAHGLDANDMAALEAAARAGGSHLWQAMARAASRMCCSAPWRRTPAREFTQIPYRGLPPAILAVLAGEVMLTLSGVDLLTRSPRRRHDEGAGGGPRRAGCRTAARRAHPGRGRLSRPSTRAPGSASSHQPPRPHAIQARISADIATAIADPGARKPATSLPNGYTVHAGPRPTNQARSLVAEDFAYKRRLLRRAGLTPA